MATNLVEMMQSSLVPTLVREAGRFLGESESATRGAVGVALPALLGGLMQKASTTQGAAGLFDLLSGPNVDARAASNLSTSLSNPDQATTLVKTGSGFLSALFGDKVGKLTETLSSITGVKPGAITSLLSIAAPAMLGFVKNYMSSNRLDASGLAGLLLGQKDFLGGLLDNRVTNALGLGSASSFLSGLAAKGVSAMSGMTTATAKEASTIAAGAMHYAPQGAAAMPGHEIASAMRDRSKIMRWLPLIGLAVIALALLVFWRAGPQAERKIADATTSGAAGLKSIQLPDGATIQARDGRFFDSLVTYLNSNAPAGKAFVFEDLTFQTGSATLPGDANNTIRSTAAVLKAFPAVQVSIEGYTDNIGEPAVNKKLSSDRAAAVANAIEDQGVPANRVSSTGWGQEKPVASNDSEEGRAANRRVEIIITKR